MLFQCNGAGGNRTGTDHTGYCGISENGAGRQQLFLRILEMNGRLEIGRKLLKSEGSAPGFFSIGVIAAVLKVVGKVPV